jgi:adenine-specific DNA methylase
MQNGIIKNAGMEQATLTDPRTGLPIRVSTTARLKYRKYFDETFSDRRDMLHDLSNRQLNDIIAQDFAVSSDSVVHMFVSNTSSVETQKRSWIEIRKVKTRRAFNFFFSVIRPDGIDILTTSTRYNKPRKPRVFVPKF